METFRKLILSMLITAAVYCVVTLPYICYIFFGWGLVYDMHGIMLSSLVSIVAGHFISARFKL